MREANELVGGWMRDAGLAVREDAAGNLIGRRDERPADAGARLAPRHGDRRRAATTGRSACWPAIGVAERLRELPFALEVVGVRRRGGRPLRHVLPRLERDGGPLRPALARRRGRRRRHAWPTRCAPSAATRTRSPPPPARRTTCSPTVELHIEQGPVLERADVARRRRDHDHRPDPRRGRASAARPAMPARCRWTRAATRWPRPPSGAGRRGAGPRAPPGAGRHRRAARRASRARAT